MPGGHGHGLKHQVVVAILDSGTALTSIVGALKFDDRNPQFPATNVMARIKVVFRCLQMSHEKKSALLSIESLVV